MVLSLCCTERQHDNNVFFRIAVFKVVVNDTLLKGRNKEMGGVRDNKTEGATTPNVVIKEILT